MSEDDSVLTKFGQRRLKEVAKQRSEPAGRDQVLAYYCGWLTAVSQLGFGLAFLLILFVGGALVIIGDVSAFEWGIRVVFYFLAALVAGWLSDITFEASGVEP